MRHAFFYSDAKLLQFPPLFARAFVKAMVKKKSRTPAPEPEPEEHWTSHHDRMMTALQEAQAEARRMEDREKTFSAHLQEARASAQKALHHVELMEVWGKLPQWPQGLWLPRWQRLTSKLILLGHFRDNGMAYHETIVLLAL